MSWTTLLWLFGSLFPIIHVIGAGFAIHAILFSRTSQGAIAWGMSLFFVPYVTIPLYLVFGRQRFHGYVEARRTGDQRFGGITANLVEAMNRFRTHLHGEMQRFSALEKLTIAPFTTGNAARLLIDGTETFDAIFGAIDGAQKYLLVQFFIVRDDALGYELKRRLIARAKGGVKVYFLYDEIGCFRLPGGYTDELREAGVEVSPFNSRRGWLNRLQINFRNHRKIVLADGEVAYVGGHNVGDEYVGKSRFGRWRDTQIEVRGPAVATVQFSFFQDWHWATGQLLELPRAEAPAVAGPSDAIVVQSGPADEINTCTLMLLSLISAARKRLWITSPYFVPDETVYDALQLAAIRGVDVRIMLPAKPDHLLVYLSSFSYLESAEAAGVKFYRYTSGFLHQKVWLVDEDLAAVGTANIDNRSMRLNFELTILLIDKGFNERVAGMLAADFENCRQAKAGDLQRRGLLFRFSVRLARLLSPVQ